MPTTQLSTANEMESLFGEALFFGKNEQNICVFKKNVVSLRRINPKKEEQDGKR